MNIDSTVYWSIVVLSVMKRVDFGTLELYVTMCICDRRDGVCRRKNMELRREWFEVTGRKNWGRLDNVYLTVSELYIKKRMD